MSEGFKLSSAQVAKWKGKPCPLCGGTLSIWDDGKFDCKHRPATHTRQQLKERLSNGAPAGLMAPTKQLPEPPPKGKLSLAEYGLDKNLEYQLLVPWFGLREDKHRYYKEVEKAVCIPYWNERGELVAEMWRWAMGKYDENGHTNREVLKGGHRCLYGGHFLEYLEKKAENNDPADEIWLCEGESNTQTLWQNHLPALGLPGIQGWKSDWRNLKCLREAKRIYFLLDMKDGKPEEVAILGARKVAEDFPPGKVLAVKLPVKDVSELWKLHTQALAAPTTIVDHTEILIDEGPRRFLRELKAAVFGAKPIIPEREDIEGQPADLGAVVLDACPILKDFVALALPRLETDINNIVCDFLACAGAAIGLKAYRMHEADKHDAATYHLLIAETSTGKGTCWGLVNKLFNLAVPGWGKSLRTSARSQQALYREVLECSAKRIGRVNKRTGEIETLPNPRYSEGRLILRYGEISAVFKSLRAEWSTLSQGFRDVFDRILPLSNERAQESDSIVVNDPYAVAVSGDVTPWELSEVIQSVDFANGCANRFIWCVAHKTKTIPRSTGKIDLQPLAERLKRVLPPSMEIAQSEAIVPPDQLVYAPIENPVWELEYSEEGAAAWDAWVYSIPEDTGKLGSACARMRAHALRLCTLFAVLDESRLSTGDPPKIEARHVKAAAAIMDRHRATVAWFLARPAAMPIAAPESEKAKLWRQVEKVQDARKEGPISATKLHGLFSNKLTAEQEKEIAAAAGLQATEEMHGKAKTLVWK